MIEFSIQAGLIDASSILENSIVLFPRSSNSNTPCQASCGLGSKPHRTPGLNIPEFRNQRRQRPQWPLNGPRLDPSFYKATTSHIVCFKLVILPLVDPLIDRSTRDLPSSLTRDWFLSVTTIYEYTSYNNDSIKDDKDNLLLLTSIIHFKTTCQLCDIPSAPDAPLASASSPAPQRPSSQQRSTHSEVGTQPFNDSSTRRLRLPPIHVSRDPLTQVASEKHTP